MNTVNAYAAAKTNGELKPFTFDLPPLGPHDVDITVETCGVCHSDLSMVANEWRMTKFPFVPGHEVIGRIAAVGEHVTRLSIGDWVGLGWHSGYCMACDQCLAGDQNLCRSAPGTIVGRYGGFADTVRAQDISVFKLPTAVNPQSAGPLLCGGITVFHPMLQLGLSPTASVGVIGIGGLGHMALQFAKAWGCHVTAFTSHESKFEDALSLGAHVALNSRDSGAIKKAAGRFDLLLSTVNVSLDWNLFMGTLAPRGRLHMLGAVTEPLALSLMPMIAGQLSIGASPVGSPGHIRKMLDFAGRHQIAPVTEHFPMSRVNDAMEHLRSGKARYRIVLDRD